MVAIASFISPELYVIFPYVKRIKLWEAELELQEKVKDLKYGKDQNDTEIAIMPREDIITSEDIAIGSKDNNEALKYEKREFHENINKIIYYANYNSLLALDMLRISIEKEVNTLMSIEYNRNINMPITYLISKRGYKTVDDKFFPLYRAVPDRILDVIIQFLEISSQFKGIFDDKMIVPSNIIMTGIGILELLFEEKHKKLTEKKNN